MKTITGLARRFMKSRVAVALTAVTFVAVTAAVTWAQILKDATGVGGQTGNNQNQNNLNDLVNIVNGLTDKALPITVTVAPLVFVAGALLMQFGGPSGTRRAAAVMYGSVGAVAAVAAAKGLMA